MKRVSYNSISNCYILVVINSLQKGSIKIDIDVISPFLAVFEMRIEYFWKNHSDKTTVRAS